MRWRSCISILLTLTVLSCRPLRVTQLDAYPKSVDGRIGDIDSSVYRFIGNYKTILDEQMDVVISSSPVDLIKKQPSCNLGNMLADIIFSYALEHQLHPDFALMNQGGIRVVSINKGDLTVRDAYQIMPFDNQIVVLELPGQTVSQLIKHTISAGGWPIANATVIVDTLTREINITIAGEALDSNKTYRVATNDYIANGGDQCNFLPGNPLYNTEYLLRDAIIDSWRRNSKGLSIDETQRIRYE